MWLKRLCTLKFGLYIFIFIILFYKIINKDPPQYLQNMTPHPVADQHQHNTRQSHDIVERRTYIAIVLIIFYQLL